MELINWFNQLLLGDRIEILRPELAWLPMAVLLASLLAFWLWRQARVQRGKTMVADEGALRRMFVISGNVMQGLVAGIAITALVAMSLAAIDPAVLERVPKEEAYIELAIDVSDSMLNTDVEPNRLAGALNGAQHFLELAPEEGNINVGIVTYHGQVNELIAPTTDYERVSDLLETVQVGAGTAIGDALLRANDELKPFVEGTPLDEPVPAAIVLLSDGESTTGSAVSTALSELRETRIPVHAIGYAISDEQSSQAQLQAIAAATGGAYLTADNPKQLEVVFEQLAYTSAFETTTHSVAAGYAIKGLGAMLLALLMGMLATRIPLNSSKTKREEETQWTMYAA